jgi:AraC-like DNA-binding protein
VLIAALSFSLSQLLLSLVLLFSQGRWQISERLFALLLLAIACYLLVPLTSGTWVGFVSGSLQAAVPGMFWLFSASVFDDHFQLRPWQLLLVLATVALPVLGRLPGTESAGWFFISVPQALEFLLIGLTLWAVAQHWRVDLVAARRRMRLLFVGLNGLYIFALILSREVIFADADWLASGQYLPLGGMLLAMNVSLLRYRQDGLFLPLAVDAPAISSGAQPTGGELDSGLVSSLQALMSQSNVYREMGLTIGQLAERLDVPQYRLRHTINGGLGYRNFSDFLNSYRVAEAAERLGDAAQLQVAVLTIAMDAGFRSLSSFNKAFKDTHGITPSQYRKSIKN